MKSYDVYFCVCGLLLLSIMSERLLCGVLVSAQTSSKSHMSASLPNSAFRDFKLN